VEILRGWRFLVNEEALYLSAAEGRGKTSNGFKDFYLTAMAIIWS
jgi:hypothetical protein